MAEKLLNYADVSAISYEPGDMAITLSPAQQSLAVQAVSLFAGGDLWYDYATNSDAIDAAVADLMFALQDVTVPPPIGLQNRFLVNHAFAQAMTGNSFLGSNNVNQMGGYNFQNVAAVNDAWRHQYIHLRAGTWRMDLLWASSPSSGRLEAHLTPDTGSNISLFNTLEMYAAAAAWNKLNTASFTVPANMNYTLNGAIPSKIAASTGFNCNITMFSFTRTGD